MQVSALLICLAAQLRALAISLPGKGYVTYSVYLFCYCAAHEPPGPHGLT